MKSELKKINLRYFAVLREQAGLSSEEIMTDAQTPRALYAELSAKYRFTIPIERMGAAINNQFCKLDQELASADTVVFIPPVAGG